MLTIIVLEERTTTADRILECLILYAELIKVTHNSNRTGIVCRCVKCGMFSNKLGFVAQGVRQFNSSRIKEIKLTSGSEGSIDRSLAARQGTIGSQTTGELIIVILRTPSPRI